MKQAQEPGKRIVSKGAYVQRQGQRIGIGFLGFCLFVVSGVCVLTLLTSVIFFIWDWRINSLLVLCLFTPLSYYTVRFTRATLIHAASFDTGVPLTRANTADLPASESLARASSEPMQAQEAVLLRASVGEAQERPEKAGQLLRAAAEGQEPG